MELYEEIDKIVEENGGIATHDEIMSALSPKNKRMAETRLASARRVCKSSASLERDENGNFVSVYRLGGE